MGEDDGSSVCDCNRPARVRALPTLFLAGNDAPNVVQHIQEIVNHPKQDGRSGGIQKA